MCVAQIFVQESHNQLLFRTAVQIAGNAIVLLTQSPMSLLQEAGARTVRDQLLGLLSVVFGCLCQKHLFELLLIKLARILAYFDQHLD